MRYTARIVVVVAAVIDLTVFASARPSNFSAVIPENDLFTRDVVKQSRDELNRFQSIRSVLMKYSLKECCPSWQEIVKFQEVSSELKKVYGRNWTDKLLVNDLLLQLKSIFVNITYFSIEGQPGSSEWERYYNFYDSVQYYLRLMKVANDYLQTHKPNGTSFSGLDSNKDDEFKIYQKLARYVRSMDYKMKTDPTMSDFMNELLTSPANHTTIRDAKVNGSAEQKNVTIEDDKTNGNASKTASTLVLNPNFEFYEDFIGSTQFGHYYATNISMIREYVDVFNRIFEHVLRLRLNSNYTRPSLQYMMLKRLSHELFYLKHEITEKVAAKIWQNRQDVRDMFSKLDDLVNIRPEVKILGDEFESSDTEQDFSACVRKLTHLLDLYTTNNLTQLSFYDQLTELPEKFIMLGAKIAHDYEVKEVPLYKRFNNQLLGWQYPSKNLANLDLSDVNSKHLNQSSHNASSMPTDARNSNLSLISRLFT